MRHRVPFLLAAISLAIVLNPASVGSLTCDSDSYSLWIDFNSDDVVQVDEYRCAPLIPDWSGAPTVNDFVSVPGFGPHHASVLRSYRTVLGREPDLAGASFWLSFLDDDKHSVHDVYELMMLSPEYLGFSDTEQEDTAFLDAAYSRSFDRAPDTAGREFWLASLETDGLDRPRLLLAFAVSEEMRETTGLIPLWQIPLAPPQTDPDWLPLPY